MIKVLFVVHTLNLGGAERNLVNLLERVDRTRVTAAVVVLHEVGHFGETVRSWDVPVYELRLAQVGVLRAFSRLYTALRAFRPDVLHGVQASGGLWAIAGALLIRKRAFVHFHGSLWRLSRKTRLLASCLCRLAAGVIVPSNSLVDEVVSHLRFPRNRIRVVPNGVPLEAPVPDASDRSGVFTFAVAARLVELKGHRYLLEAMECLARSGVVCRLDILGEGPMRASLEEQTTRLDLSGRVVFHGQVSDVVPWLARVHALVLPSMTEVFPVSLVEGLAMGLPVIATSVGGVPEIVRHGVNGLLVPPGDADALAKAMRSLVCDPELLRKLSEAAVPSVQHLSLEANLEALYSIYGERITARQV